MTSAQCSIGVTQTAPVPYRYRKVSTPPPQPTMRAGASKGETVDKYAGEQEDGESAATRSRFHVLGQLVKAVRASIQRESETGHYS